jgi:dTDP-4-amino-4,6-dideoxygalactose transaminase
MHYGGYPGHMAEINAICARRNISVIEDACHAPTVVYGAADGSSLDGRKVGALGRVACFSFFSNKNLASGEGGMITTDDDQIAARTRALRSHGMTTLTWDRHRGHASTYDVTRHGYNYRLDEMRAAIGRAQLRKLSAGNARRRELTRRYHQLLGKVSGLVLPFAGWTRDSGGHLMPVVARDGDLRSRIVEGLKAQGIQTSLHYPAIPSFSAFKASSAGPLPLTTTFSERVITLPLYPGLSDDQVASIAKAITGVVET